MNRDQARNLVKETFTQKFDKSRFMAFVGNLLNHLDVSDATSCNSRRIKNAYKPHVNLSQRIGTYTSPDNQLVDVLIVRLTDQAKLIKTRTAIRNFVADYLAGDRKDAALVAFVSPSENAWRFSYVKMEYATVEKPSGEITTEERLTPARRFSYLVGPGESCHTAQTRFIDLLQDTQSDPSLAQIEDAFSVEAVTKEFFGRYKELYLEVKEELDKLATNDKAIGSEFTACKINTADFAKKLMGQIVFLHFLQKKGWLGVEKDKEWGSGPHNFLRRLAQGEYKRDTGSSACADQSHPNNYNFFNDTLEPLFYDTLATDRGHDAWCDCYGCRIPFLNGGLFEPLGGYNWRKTEILLPNRLFTNKEPVEEAITGTGILDVFDRYNFTVNEAEPLEKEVAIDPEMLGKVFENLLEVKERKSKGSFYTPREIVHYMCQESLINYLDTAINGSTDIPVCDRGGADIPVCDQPQSETGISACAASASTNTDRNVCATLQQTQTRMSVPRSDIEIFIHTGDQAADFEAARLDGTKSYAPKLPKSIEDHARLLDEKLAAITVCDPAIGSGAFPVGMMQEIVRARTALTPYFNDVQERTAYHFKRHAIQNCLYGVDIDPGAVEIAKLRLWLSLVVDEEDVQQIKPLPNLDYKVVVGNSLLGVEKNLFNQQLFQQLEALKPLYFDQTDGREKECLRRQIDGLIHQLTDGKEAFDFEIYFSEVFHRKKGFDVVIQNPPYVQIKGIPAEERRIYEERYEFATGRFNLFYLFIERCKLLSRTNGHASFIIPDRLLLNTQCKAIRDWLLNENSIRELISFADQVFETVVVGSILLLFGRGQRGNDLIRARRKVSQRNVHRAQPISIPVSYFQLSPSAQFDLNFTPAKFGLYRKIKERAIELVQISETRDGIIQGKVEDHLFLRIKQDSQSKPLLFGEDVERYSITSSKNWVNYKPEEMMALEIKRRGEGVRPGLWMREPRIFERPKILTRQTADEIIAAYDEENFYYTNTLHGTAVVDRAYHPLYLLGVLNSRITTWYYRSNTDEEGKVFAQVKIELLRKLPIPSADKDGQKPIVQLVDRILAAKAADAEADTSVLEREIDRVVYQLYNLSPEEIAIVEGAGQARG